MAQVPPDSELDRATDMAYAAVSVSAVVGLLFSILGAVAVFLRADFLVVVPLTGLVISAIALRHIRRSNGVLTGRWVAVLGIAIGGLLTVTAGGYRLLAWHQEQSRLEHLRTASLEVADALASGDYEKVLQRLPPRYRGPRRVTAELLRDRFSRYFSGPVEQRTVFSLHTGSAKPGELNALARVRVVMKGRVIELALLWSNAPSPDVPPETWQLVNAYAEETLESSTHPGSTEAAPKTPPEETPGTSPPSSPAEAKNQ